MILLVFNFKYVFLVSVLKLSRIQHQQNVELFYIFCTESSSKLKAKLTCITEKEEKVFWSHKISAMLPLTVYIIWVIPVVGSN